MRRVFIACATITLLGASCTPPALTGADNDSGGSSDNTDPGSRFALTVTLRSLNGCRGLDPEADFGCTGMEAHVFLDDRAYTRSDAPYNNGNFDSTLRGGGDPEVREFQLEAGTVVTIVVFESEGVAQGVTSAFQREDFEMGGRLRVEFVRFEGDSVPIVESGVVAFGMDSDKSIDVVYQRMPTLVVTAGGTEPFLPGFWETLTVNAPEWLTFPERMGINGFNGTFNDVSFNFAMANIVYIAEMKTGTTITFQAGSLEPFAFKEWNQNVSPCGGTSCTVTLGTDELLEAIWELP